MFLFFFPLLKMLSVYSLQRRRYNLLGSIRDLSPWVPTCLHSLCYKHLKPSEKSLCRNFWLE
jgi:hypothetical protein